MLEGVKISGYRNRLRKNDENEILLEIASDRGARNTDDADHKVSVGSGLI
jgi:hypothetical protein